MVKNSGRKPSFRPLFFTIYKPFDSPYSAFCSRTCSLSFAYPTGGLRHNRFKNIRYLCIMVEKFIAYIRAEKRYSENTAAAYERDIRRFLADTGIDPEQFDPAQITSDDIRDWIVSLSESGLSATSVNRMTSSLRALFGWLRKTGAVTGDPFLRIGFQRTPSRLPAFVPEAKMEQVVDAAGEETAGDFESQRNALIILLFYSTGIRLAELLNIRLNDFSSGFRELRVRGKGNKERVVPLIDYTRARVREYTEKIKAENICTDGGNSLFLNSKGRAISRYEVYRIVKNELTRAGVQGKRSPHVLRHTFATHMLNDGADIREIQQMLGHSSLSATQVYTHNSITKLKEAYKTAHPRERNNEE